jgi:hypothetical protein
MSNTSPPEADPLFVYLFEALEAGQDGLIESIHWFLIHQRGRWWSIEDSVGDLRIIPDSEARRILRAQWDAGIPICCLPKREFFDRLRSKSALSTGELYACRN